MSTYHFNITGIYFLHRYELDFEVSINEFINWAKKYWIFAKFRELENPEMDSPPYYHSEGDYVGIYTKGSYSIEADSYEEAMEEMIGVDFGELEEIEYEFTYEE